MPLQTAPGNRDLEGTIPQRTSNLIGEAEAREGLGGRESAAWDPRGVVRGRRWAVPVRSAEARCRGAVPIEVQGCGADCGAGVRCRGAVQGSGAEMPCRLRQVG